MSAVAVLKGEGRTGDAVHAGQEMSAAEGFGKVAKKWLRTTMTYDQGFELLAKHKGQSQDILATVKEMVPSVTSEGNFAFIHRDTGAAYRPTEFAMTQVGSWAECGSWLVTTLLNPAGPLNSKDEPKYLRDRLDAETLRTIVDNGFRRIDPTKVFLWRVNTTGYLRAMLSDQYARVNNFWFLETLQRLIPGGRLSHWDKSDTETIWGNVLIPDTIREEDDSDYGGMLSVGNSQIGERDLNSLPSVFRAICQNGCIWDQQKGIGIKRRHRGDINLEELFTAIRDNLEKQIPLLPRGIDQLMATKRLLWTSDSVKPLFAEVAHEFSLTKKQASAMLEGYAKEVRETDARLQRSLFGVINAVTRAGQGMPRSADWYKMDGIGGKLSAYDASDWASLTGRAKALKVKEVEEAFAVAA